MGRKKETGAQQENVFASEIIIYQEENGKTRIQVRLLDATVWLPQKGIAELYQRSVPTINEHISNIYSEKELMPEATIRKFRIVQHEGDRKVSRLVDFYDLEMILAVGYRVRSQRGTQFRQWATTNLREFLVKGFVMDDDRLKEDRALGGDYFDELLERIRDIRASERRFYQKITDIYATSIDYEPASEITQTFYATVQNKLHWAIHGRTAAEVIMERADASKPNMGLATWKNAPRGPVRRHDVYIAKNYLSGKEISALNRVVTMYLDYAELQAENRRPMHMADWVKRLDAFLEFNEQNILTHAGTVSHDLAIEHAEREFSQYRERIRQLEASTPVSDFDKAVEKVQRLGKGNPAANSKANTKKDRKKKRVKKKK